MQYFNNIKDLWAYIDKQIPKNLMKIGNEIKNVLRYYVQTKWYDNYTPEYYDRTFELIESITVSEARKENDGWVVEVYFDPDKIKPQDSTVSWKFPAHKNVTNGDTQWGGQNISVSLPWWVEKGQHSKIHSYIGIHMVEETVRWAKEDQYLIHNMYDLLKEQGF